MLAEIIQLRRELHMYPETSGLESNTAERIISFIKMYNPTEIIENIGGNGIAAIYEFSSRHSNLVKSSYSFNLLKKMDKELTKC